MIGRDATTSPTTPCGLGSFPKVQVRAIRLHTVHNRRMQLENFVGQTIKPKLKAVKVSKYLHTSKTT